MELAVFDAILGANLIFFRVSMHKLPPSDTSPAAEQFLIDAYNRMTVDEKMERVFSLNRMLEQLQRARIKADYGEMPEREMQLRLASLRLGRDLMVKAFGWDPEVKGW